MNDDRRAPSRRSDDTVTRLEFADFQTETKRYRCEQGKKLDSIHTALFARDEDNEHNQPGLMHTARNIDQHITSICTISRWTYRAVLAFVAVAAPTAALGKALGWW